MKKIIPLLFLIILFSCDSSFDLDTGIRQEYTNDDEGDPVIENVENVDIHQLGVGGGSCYGYSEPQNAEMAEIEIDTTLILPTQYDISEYLPEVRSQGRQGSCVAWATGYYLKSYQENYESVQNGIFNSNFEMSPAYIYNQIKVTDCAGGSFVQQALDTLVSQGIVGWNIMVYNDNECETQPNNLQKVLAEPNKIENYFYFDEELVFDYTKASLLNDQPVVIAITIDRNYFGARDENGEYIYRKFKSSDGGHAMLVVGYDDDRNAFKVVNSWGKNWGNEGFIWIDYKAFQEAGDLTGEFPVLCEAWITNDVIITQPASL
ncbi:C1 family peptidase [Lutimonas halocynthiae]|uniref:C1 family peptidase n=1 Tax=Lutimonas halocynthiae TaxID=1446477 RepID=UPI0025B2ACE1|nr:C1 family peptidase [Lutimonas halocynthiae]MDN3642657.1 C1 family peptidase [Lutimonas halocynthiae]